MAAPAAARSSLTLSGLVRGGLEMLICLGIAVALFRTFLLEGYVIETGSMAPCLLGRHRTAVCPKCQYEFATEENRGGSAAVCPNCGEGGIDVEDLVPQEGDHLLVSRAAFEVHTPQRWETVVFRNPLRPTQAFVKRLAGLPGEELQIRHGDIYIGGKIQRKDLIAQRAMRIIVYDADFPCVKSDMEWHPRWTGSGAWETGDKSFTFRGTATANATAGSADSKPAAQLTAEDGAEAKTATAASKPAAKSTPAANAGEMTWLQYRHWIREGGTHATSVPLARWPESVDLPRASLDRVRYDAEKQTLICWGVLPPARKSHWLAVSDSPELKGALEQLELGSHISPIVDDYGYNRRPDAGGQNPVYDLMLAARVAARGTGEWALGLSDGVADLDCTFDYAARQVRLVSRVTGETLRNAELPPSVVDRTALVEMSLMDGQALVAVDGKQVFDPWTYDPPATRPNVSWRPARVGARGLDLEVTHLRLYRDVFYTAGEDRRGSDRPVSLGPEEYFALGDNSPISRDARSWPADQHLESGMLLGKPILVHLPARNCRLKIGRWTWNIRIPDISRIRYIR